MITPGSSAKPLHEHLLIINDDSGRRELQLLENHYTIGRSPLATIRVRSQFVSRIHATLIRQAIEATQTVYRIIDGDGSGNTSVNGLLINQKKYADYIIQNGDEIILGPQVSIQYEYRRRDQFSTRPGHDEFDITLIDPSMIEEEEDAPTALPSQPTTPDHQKFDQTGT